jgi:hypothetical protein
MQAHLTGYEYLEQNVYTVSETLHNFFTWVDLPFLNFLSDQGNSRRVVCKTCKDKEGKASIMHFRVLRTAERFNTCTIHTMCILGTDISERKMRE